MKNSKEAKINLKYFFYILLIVLLSLYKVRADITEELVYDLNEDGTAHVTLTFTTDKAYSWYKSPISGKVIKGTEKTNGKDVETTTINKYDFSSRTSYEYSTIKTYLPDTPGTFKTEVDVQLTEKYGLIYTINLLGFLGERITELRVPTSWGEPVRVFPKPNSQTQNGGKYIFFWKNSTPSISLQFGDHQAYRFRNEFYFSEYTSPETIVFPPELDHHQGGFGLDSPKPSAVYTDNDGNYYVDYEVAESGYVNLTYEVNVYYREYQFEKSGYKNDIPLNLMKYTTGDGKYWNVDHTEIKNIVDTHTDDSKTVAENARNLYEYTVDFLSHANPMIYSFRKRLTTDEILNDPDKGVCIDIANFYITLLRKSGIPSRLLIGWADNGKSKEPQISILHAWVQFYVPNVGWVEVDPSWEITSKRDYFYSFDTNHVVLLVLGESPEYPEKDLFLAYFLRGQVLDREARFNPIIVSSSKKEVTTTVEKTTTEIPEKTAFTTSTVKLITKTTIPLDGEKGFQMGFIIGFFIFFIFIILGIVVIVIVIIKQKKKTIKPESEIRRETKLTHQREDIDPNYETNIQQLVSYIKQCKNLGLSEIEIKNELIKAGWDNFIINEAFKRAGSF